LRIRTLTVAAQYALAHGTTDPARLAALGDESLPCGRQKLIDALRGAPTPTQLQILKLHLERLAKSTK
jgi:hypothetical protein